MVHKKYIKRGDKVFGPYLYENYRERGIVKTRYLGKEKNLWVNLNFSYFIGAIVFVLLLAFFLINFNLTGNVSLSIDDVYFAQENITGDVKFFLEQGELIPGATNVIFQINDYSYNYFLNDLVSDELTEGDFYINGKNISGRG
ncbi:MAG: hypothetical protein ABIG37_00935, partial [Nanoarchaeota archaeon]